MSDQKVDQGKRTWLIATGCAGAVGGVATAVPFVSTFAPSERAKAAGAPVEVDISGIKPGEKLTVEWRGKPVWIVRRTPDQIAAVAKAFVVTYNKVPGSAPDRYLMAHSQLAFLMDPEGKPLALLPLDDPATDIDEGAPDKVAAELAKWVK